MQRWAELTASETWRASAQREAPIHMAKYHVCSRNAISILWGNTVVLCSYSNKIKSAGLTVLSLSYYESDIRITNISQSLPP